MVTLFSRKASRRQINTAKQQMLSAGKFISTLNQWVPWRCFFAVKERLYGDVEVVGDTNKMFVWFRLLPDFVPKGVITEKFSSQR